MGKQLRRIGEPVVASPPAGVRVRTRLHLSEDEAAALGTLGEYLGSVYRRELAHRISMGHLDLKAHAVWRAERKQAVTAVASSRWAGAITRASEDQYQLGMRALTAQVADLRAAIAVLERRCGLRPGETPALAQDGQGGPRRVSRRPVRGYASAAQRFSKTRRLATLRARLAEADAVLAAGHPSITMGGNRLWRTRPNLAAAEMTEQQWRGRWDAARMFLTADGESGKAGGNETIRVDAHGQLRIKVPVALADRFGTHLLIAAPVVFNHRSDEWGERVRDQRAVRYDITFDPQRGRWYLDASWTITPAPIGEFDELRDGHVLGVDLNADHLAACVLDSSGNPVGAPDTIPVDTAGLPARRRDGRVRAAITTLLDLAVAHNCTAVVVENLDFADARSTGRETLGPRPPREMATAHRRRDPHRQIQVPAHLDGVPPQHRGHRRGPRLHHHVGAPALAHTPATTDFRPGHCDRASWCGGRDRQTWTRRADQASSGRTPHPTADACGHSTGQT